jgi:hypothetical protein
VGAEKHGQKWVARLRIGGARVFLGAFGTKEAADEVLAQHKRMLADGTSPYAIPGATTIAVFAETNGLRLGTVKRWIREGMPRHLVRGVALIPIKEAKAWIAKTHPDSICFDRQSVVYFVQRDSDGAIKIGWSSDVVRRLAELRKVSRCELRLLACFPGDKPDELRMHELFAELLIGDEWFRADAAILQFLRGMCETAARRLGAA